MTTTGWPRWSPTWCRPTRWCCCPTSTASTPAIPAGRAPTLVSRGQSTPADLAGVRLGGTGPAVGTGGMATKLDAALIATGAGIPVLLAAAESVATALAGTGGTYFAPTGAADRVPAVLAAPRHHPARPAGARRRRGRSGGAAAGVAAAGRHHRGQRRLRGR